MIQLALLNQNVHGMDQNAEFLVPQEPTKIIVGLIQNVNGRITNVVLILAKLILQTLIVLPEQIVFGQLQVQHVLQILAHCTQMAPRAGLI